MRYARRPPAKPQPPHDNDLMIENAVMVPIRWLEYGLELLASHNESGTTVEKLRRRAADWTQFKAPGRRPVRLDEQRAEFEKACPLPPGIIWAEAENKYVSAHDTHKQHQQARKASVLYEGFLLRAFTPEGK